jgi:hypothetical protein
MGETEPRRGRGCPVGEQLDRLGCERRVRRNLRRRLWHGERVHTPDGLTVDAQDGATGRHQVQILTAAHERASQSGAGLQQVLAVVEYQQQTLVSEPLDQVGGQLSPRSLLDTQHCADKPRYQLGVTERRQLDEPHAIRPLVSLGGRYFERQSRLADATRPHEGHQSRRGHETRDLFSF